MMMKEKRRENNNKNRFIKNLAILIVVALVTNILMYSPIHVSAAPKKTVSYEPLRYVDIECNTALKAGSGDSYDTIGNIPENTRIYSYGYDRYDANTAWYKVTYNGTVGYINADDCHLSYQAYNPQKTGQTTANMYMRSGVGLDYTKKKYIKSGSLITLHGYYRTEGYDWYKITYNGITGYVSSKYVKRIENMPKTTVTYNPLRYVDVETNTIFKNGSSASASELGTIPEGTRIYSYGYDRYDANTAWYKVAYDGTVGYINADDCHLSYQAYTPVRTGKTTANMYMRSGVGLDYTKKTYIKSGSSITLYGYYRTEGYDWYKIKYNGKTGYVSSKYVNRLDAQPISTVKYNPLRYVDVTKKTTFKKGSNESAAVIGTVPEGTRIYSYGYDRYDANTAWYKVIYNGTIGYINADDCHLSYQEYTPVRTGKTTANMYMRSGVGLDYTKKTYIKSGSSITLYGYYRTEGYDWYKIKYNGKTGYVSSKYVNRLEIPNVKADFGNLSATISWDKLDGATKYKVYRKLGPNGTFRLLGETTDTTYTDVYVQSAKTESEKNYLCASVFVDPSINPYSYTVKACYVEDGKETYSDYLKDGVCHIETPSIVSVDKISNTTATIEWSTLKNATSYLIYTGVKDDNGVHWTEVKEVKHKSATRQKETITVNADHTYYTIKAKFVRDGKTVYSDFDQNFTIENRNYQDKNILYIGDSITFGSPYKGATTVEVFSYPWRVQQLTGVKMYNPSIPGATYAYKDDKSRDRLVEDVAVPMNEGRTPYKALHENKQTYKDFDIVIMAAGTNDYADSIKLGDKDSTDRTEFNGALNEIMGYIDAASEERVQEGKEPIKVVFVDLFYSNRTNIYSELTNRFITPNGIGLTLTDYQNNLNDMIEKYKSEGVDIYQFHTSQFVTEDTCDTNTSDNLHMTRYTYTQIGNELSEFLIKNDII